jgi:hypothetical protein
MKAILKLKSFPDHKGRPGEQGGSLPADSEPVGNVAKTVTFYTAVNQEFPHERLANMIEAIRSGRQKDWYRGAGVLRVAAESNANNKYGHFIQDKYDNIMKRIKAIAEQQNFDMGLLQD